MGMGMGMSALADVSDGNNVDPLLFDPILDQFEPSNTDALSMSRMLGGDVTPENTESDFFGGMMTDKERTALEQDMTNAGSNAAMEPYSPHAEARAAILGLQPIQNSIGMKLKWLPPGNFQMGSNDVRHEVKLTKPFMLGVHEVTQEQYERVMDVNPSAFKGSNNPVDNVSWDDAVEFCRKLSELPAEKAAGRVYRLPTEAEWEYACRAETTTAYSFGDDDTELGEYAWLKQNSGDKTHPVGGKKPNAWGLYDMHGNVWEWCQDWYGEYPIGTVTDPTGATSGLSRVIRGGGCINNAKYCRSAYRYGFNPALRSLFNGRGFRVSLSPSGK